MIAILQPYLIELPVFRDLNIDFINHCSSIFNYHIYTTHDYIFRTGEIATSLYIITSGEVSFVGEGNSEGTQYSNRTNGAIGESEFLCKTCYNCTATCTSNEATIIFELTFENFWKLLKKYKLQFEYIKLIYKNNNSIKKSSSTFLVQQLKANLKNTKMLRMLTRTAVIMPNKSIILPDSTIAMCWSVLYQYHMTYS